MVVEVPSPPSPPREEPEPISNDETNIPNPKRCADITHETNPLVTPCRTNAEPTWKSDLRLSTSIRQTRQLYNLFELKQLEDEPLQSFLDRFKEALLDLDETSEEVLLQAFQNGLSYRSRFRDDLYLRP
ncbi:unnamed protein product [Microthlaspi erraticum]|uniref:Retrotransposon gag domain-containing protein n=1 Tax=Microthlaspi erraticum TaxID=1685480 RepID=A0A6D2JZF9_9BRAS|nr:unnamed protein product [Microthlaspi erraticum]